jgi:hypothetical protein
MSSACLELQASALIPVGTDRAFSTEGTQLTARVVQALEGLRTSESAGGSVQAGRLALDEAVRECSEYDWDGYGAAPASELSVEWAGRMLEVVPSTMPSPEVAFDPGGDVLFEWISDHERVLSVSIGTAGEVRFALRTPAAKLTGIEAFTDALPPGLAYALATFRR